MAHANGITNVAGLHTQLETVAKQLCAVRLEAVVCTASPSGRILVLADDSGAELVMLEGGTPVAPGQRVLLEGKQCELTRLNWGIALSQPPVVDNDGLHGALEKSGRVSLPTGRIPFRLEWFNAAQSRALGLEYQAPQGQRIRVPESAFWQRDNAPPPGIGGWTNGLHFRCFEGRWLSLPDFRDLQPVTEGTTSDLSLAVTTRSEEVGLEFTGFLQVQRAGQHTFYLTSDDGARLFVGEPSPAITLAGKQLPPPPRKLSLGAVLPDQETYQWTEVEGVVQEIMDRSDCVEIELRSGQDQLRVGLMERAGLPVQLLLNSKVRIRGVSRPAFRTDGRTGFGLLEAASPEAILIEQLAPQLMASVPVQSIAAARVQNEASGQRILRLTGIIRPGKASGLLELTEGSDTMPLAMSLSRSAPEGSVEIFGFLKGNGTNGIFQCGFVRPLEATPAAPALLPMLTTAEQVHRLTRKEAERGYPARIRGVITCDAPELNYGNVLQDQTRGIYLYWDNNNQATVLPNRRPGFGEYWEIEGTTRSGGFAPTVQARNMTYLGEGQLPVPLNPSWDQLMSGGLDTQLVQIQGIITAADTNGVMFLTHGGKIRIDFDPTLAQEMRRHVNSLVRLRGCLLTLWDNDTHRMKLGEIRLGNASQAPDPSESLDPFDVSQKNVEDLLLYDAAAGTFQRVKIAGQLLEKRGEEFFLLNGAAGLRFVPRDPIDLKPGALLEVAGIPRLGGPSPVLREAVVRQVGSAPLPAPRTLQLEQLPLAEQDATRVRLEAMVEGVRETEGEQILDLRGGNILFSARLAGAGQPMLAVEPGSRVELTGVYASLDREGSADHSPGRFEILLSTAADVKILARPPWWTLRRLLAVTGGLGAVLVLAALWITQLRRRVEERTLQLRGEIQARERAEQQRMVAEEKSRIARDLHDDLGSSLTEIGLQANVAQRSKLSPEQITEQFGVIAEKTRAMVSALDVIVWTVDPEENTLQAAADYLGGYAEEFLAASGLDRRFRIPLELPAVSVDGHTRHGLFLAVKEILNNIVRHARASAVEFSLSAQNGVLKLEITDNGVGFDPATAPGGHGVGNLQKRLESLGGKCQIQSQPGVGTSIELSLPIKTEP